MTNVDQFESMFRSAEREVFRYESVRIESILVITDRDREGAKSFGDQVRGFLRVISTDDTVRWRDVDRSEFQTAEDLLKLVGSAKPTLICTYRNLHSEAWKWPYSLGAHLDLLSQHTDVPVMVLPHPQAQRSAEHALQSTDTVMAITDHLTRDQRLVNFSLRFTNPGGALWLTHVEDQATFEHYLAVIAKLPSIETSEARIALRDQLLKEPRDYITGCAEVLRSAGLPVKIESSVTFGSHLKEYEKLIEEHRVDLLVLNTKDADQMAMHGIAYALAVGLRHIPLLML